MTELHFHYAAMCAGKSMRLLQLAHNCETAGVSFRVYTSSVETRFGAAVIGSRTGFFRQSEVFDNATDFRAPAATAPCTSALFIDEAQFLTQAQVARLHRLAAAGRCNVHCFGIRSDFRGEPFPGSAALMAVADSLHEISSFCDCGSRATMQLRLDGQGRPQAEGPQLAIGLAQYRSVCPRCFYQGSAGVALPAQSDLV